MRKLLKSFKTEINPTEEQKVKIRKTIGTCRFIYNFYLAHNKELHESGKKFMSSSQFRVWLKCETKINQNVQKKTNLKTSLNNLEKIE